MLIFFLISVTCTLGKHLDQEEYTNYCKHQMPPREEHCDIFKGPAAANGDNHDELEEPDHQTRPNTETSTSTASIDRACIQGTGRTDMCTERSLLKSIHHNPRDYGTYRGDHVSIQIDQEGPVNCSTV